MGPSATCVGTGRLQAAVEVVRLRHRVMRADIVALLRALAQTEIRLLFFKGFALSEVHFDEPGARPYADVDALVSERDVIAVLSVARRNVSVKRHGKVLGRSTSLGQAA